MYFFLFFCTEISGNQNTGSHRESHGECNQNQINLKTKTYCGEIFLAEYSSYDNTVCHIIKLLKNISDKNWERKKKQRFKFIPFCQIPHKKFPRKSSFHKDIIAPAVFGLQVLYK